MKIGISTIHNQNQNDYVPQNVNYQSQNPTFESQTEKRNTFHSNATAPLQYQPHPSTHQVSNNQNYQQNNNSNDTRGSTQFLSSNYQSPIKTLESSRKAELEEFEMNHSNDLKQFLIDQKRKKQERLDYLKNEKEQKEQNFQKENQKDFEDLGLDDIYKN